MIIERLFAVALAIMVSTTASATSIHSAKPLVFFEIMARDAVSIALVEVTAGELLVDQMSPVLYRVNITRNVAGVELSENTCLAGPRGVRVGSRYLVFVQSFKQELAEQTAGCRVVAGIGAVIPHAVEVVTADNQLAEGEQVLLDSMKVIYPQFSGTMPVVQKVEMDDQEWNINVGSWAPLQSVLDYVNDVRSGDVN